ncbi:MAG: 3-deoxy-manno-octulosonate cytidylyltransferase [Steroidobacteraceae bacterium]|jgi:3-deoxy-manno-octulosonate cytidylyltransferase (CMP-KDO synthetase)|nr:3-deoxy-manno-octulosonate cytidylyltransferase [Steroidobacteraceae bacterium]
MRFKAVIPARYGSTRIPAKALADIGGRPMIQWVIDVALRSGAEEVLVATDDERIAAAALDPRRPQRSLAIMTRADHASGADRIAEAAALRGWRDEEVVVNVQGDEPQLPPQLVRQAAELLERHRLADIATLSTPIQSLEEFLDPNAVKVVSSDDGYALYFSRAPIPWSRDGASGGLASQTRFENAQRHLGVYAYRVGALRRLTSLPPSPLESTEKLEQLRALQAGMRIVVGVASSAPAPGVDTEHDLERVRASLGAKREADSG